MIIYKFISIPQQSSRNSMLAAIKFKMNESLYIKDPQETDLGRRILSHGITMFDELGFEAFTFKKLAKEIGSAEKSIYRYFDSKHMLLLFLNNWYWEWVNYLIEINAKNITDPRKKLEIAIESIVFATSENPMNQYINENTLHRVIINEGSKSYHTSHVDDENQSGLFFAYKSLVAKVSSYISELNPEFAYPNSLASNLFEMSNNQIFFAEHLPALSDIKKSPSCEQELVDMMKVFVGKLLA